MKGTIYTKGRDFLIQLKRMIVVVSGKAKIFGKKILVQTLALLKRLLVGVSSILKIAGKEIAKQLKSLLQKQNVMAGRNSGTSYKERSIGFKRLLRRLGIIAVAKLEESIRETKDAIKHDIEVNTQIIDKSTESVPTENTIKRTHLNEDLAQQIRQQTGLACEACEIGSLQIELKMYYSNSFAMSPRITTNRGCILVSGKSFNIIQIIQRN
jgi:hypothetical protein